MVKDTDFEQTLRFVRATSEYLTGLLEGVGDREAHPDLSDAVELAQKSLALLERVMASSTRPADGAVMFEAILGLHPSQIIRALNSMRTAPTPDALRETVYDLDDSLISAIQRVDVATGHRERDEFVETEVQRVLGALKALTLRELERPTLYDEASAVMSPARGRHLPGAAMAMGGAWSIALGIYILWERLAPDAIPRFPYQGAMWAAGVALTLVGSAALGGATFLRPSQLSYHRIHSSQYVFMFVAPYLLASIALFLLMRSRSGTGDIGALAAGSAFGLGNVVIAVASALVVRERGKPWEASRADVSKAAPGPWPLLSPSNDLSQDAAFVARLELGIRQRVRTEAQVAARWNLANYIIGGLAALLAGLGGAAGLSDLSGAPKVSLAVLGLVGSGLAGIVTTLKAGANAEAAERRKVGYDALLLDLNRARDRHPDGQVDAAVVDEVVSRLQQISGATIEQF